MELNKENGPEIWKRQLIPTGFKIPQAQSCDTAWTIAAAGSGNITELFSGE